MRHVTKSIAAPLASGAMDTQNQVVDRYRLW